MYDSSRLVLLWRIKVSVNAMKALFMSSDTSLPSALGTQYCNCIVPLVAFATSDCLSQHVKEQATIPTIGLSSSGWPGGRHTGGRVVSHHARSGKRVRRMEECILPFACRRQRYKCAGSKQTRPYPPQSTKNDAVIALFTSTNASSCTRSRKRCHEAARIQQRTFSLHLTLTTENLGVPLCFGSELHEL